MTTLEKIEQIDKWLEEYEATDIYDLIEKVISRNKKIDILEEENAKLKAEQNQKALSVLDELRQYFIDNWDKIHSGFSGGMLVNGIKCYGLDEMIDYFKEKILKGEVR